MQRFNNPFMNNNFPGMNMTNNQQNNENFQMDNQQTCGCGCNNVNVEQPNFNCCQRPKCPTTYKCCPPIVTCSKQVIDQYHVTKQPYVHNYHTEVVHHHVTQNNLYLIIHVVKYMLTNLITLCFQDNSNV